MTSDPIDVLRDLDPVPIERAEQWARGPGREVFDAVTATERLYVVDGAWDHRPRGARAGWVAAALLVVTGLAAAALLMSQRNEEPPEAPSAVDVGPKHAGLARTCSEQRVVMDGVGVDWLQVEEAFDADGAFRLPPKPDWWTVETYCGAALTAAQPEGPSPPGELPVASRPNRSPVGVRGADGDIDLVGFVNEVLALMHPVSILEVSDPSGHLVGWVAPDFEFFASDDHTAREVVADPVVVSLVQEIVALCPDEPSCDVYLGAAVGAGPAAEVGQPVGLG